MDELDIANTVGRGVLQPFNKGGFMFPLQNIPPRGMGHFDKKPFVLQRVRIRVLRDVRAHGCIPVAAEVFEKNPLVSGGLSQEVIDIVLNEAGRCLPFDDLLGSAGSSEPIPEHALSPVFSGAGVSSPMGSLPVVAAVEPMLVGFFWSVTGSGHGAHG